MNSKKKTARVAGVLYLIVVLTGIFSLGYVPSKLIVWESPSTTFQNITASETLFRLGIFASIICYITFLILPLFLYKLLHEIHKSYAITMVLLATISVPISLINLANKFAILTLIGKTDYISIMQPAEIQEQVMLHLYYYSHGVQIVSLFWGLWLLPFGYLVFKSGQLPKILGVFLMVGCAGYLINFTGKFLSAVYLESGISKFIAMPATIGEIGICLWLLILGIKEKKLPE